MIVLIGGEKGGAGKSCLAQNLSVYLQQQGRDILLIDADPQATTTDWAQERAENPDVSNIKSVQASGILKDTITDLSKKYQDIVIDVGGANSQSLRSGMVFSTHLLLPFRPKRRDLRTLDKMVQLIDMAKSFNANLKVNAIITQCPTLPSQYSRILKAKELCESYDIAPLNAVTFQRNVYDDTEENGLSVLEVDYDDKAKIEIHEIALEMFGDLNHG